MLPCSSAELQEMCKDREVKSPDTRFPPDSLPSPWGAHEAAVVVWRCVFVSQEEVTSCELVV